ncbi:transcriptional regulator HxlR family [Bacteroides sp. CAG:530]|jgi:DNA-binding HxlR family transcriptional regulator|nr:transcriptional regulator HxlR family [Bacteroides sp. CAG:530]
MQKNNEKFSMVEICPIRNVISRFGDKWSLLIILILSENEKLRFNQLGKLIPDISTKVLSSTLKTLEADNLIKRTVYPEVPPRVEYNLTETGISLVPIINQLTQWALDNMKPIIAHRKKYDHHTKCQ